jgi:hypothetical protein
VAHPAPEPFERQSAGFLFAKHRRRWSVASFDGSAAVEPILGLAGQQARLKRPQPFGQVGASRASPPAVEDHDGSGPDEQPDGDHRGNTVDDQSPEWRAAGGVSGSSTATAGAAVWVPSEPPSAGAVEDVLRLAG